MWRAFRRSEKDECSKTRELLPGYMDQRLNPEEVAHVEGHLRTCPGCREELESLRATVVLLHRLPEVTPSRSFAVAPVRSLPGRRALPALRFATAGVVLLLVLAFAVDQTDLFKENNPSTSYYGPSATSEGEAAYWLVPGVMNNGEDSSQESSVNLVVPDQTDNVYVAVNSLVTAGVLYGSVVSSPDEVPQLVLEEDAEAASLSATSAQAFLVAAQANDNADGGTNRFSINGEDSKGAVDGQNGAVLNMVPVSDNEVLYSFDLRYSQREVKAAGDNDWLRPLQYGLIGLVAVLGGATAALWLRQRRQRVVGVSKSQN